MSTKYKTVININTRDARLIQDADIESVVQHLEEEGRSHQVTIGLDSSKSVMIVNYEAEDKPNKAGMDAMLERAAQQLNGRIHSSEPVRD